jgi:hypothetical protein
LKTDALSDSSLSELVVEVKDLSSGNPPFNDQWTEAQEPFAVETDTSSRDILGHLTAYAFNQFHNQYRTHVFQVLIHGVQARLIRWDRAGAVVSEGFNYTERDCLAQFFWRYTHASAKVRGHDTTVRRLSPEDSGLSGLDEGIIREHLQLPYGG